MRRQKCTDCNVPTPASWYVVLEAEKLREPKNGKKAVEKILIKGLIFRFGGFSLSFSKR